MELSATSQRISAGFAKPSWLTLKRHLFNMHVPKELFKAIHGAATNDTENEFKHEGLSQRAAKIHISETLNGLVGMDFVDYG